MSQLKPNVEKQLNIQVQREIQSAYIYLGIMTYFDDQNFPGIASYYEAAAKEEMEHAELIMTFISDRGGRIELESLEKPPCFFDNVVDAFQLTLDHECQVTEWINELYQMAKDEKDYATEVFMQQLVTEQVEEEKESSEKLEQVKVICNNPVHMMMFDRQLGKEAAAPPSDGGH
jgi:ferritin